MATTGEKQKVFRYIVVKNKSNKTVAHTVKAKDVEEAKAKASKAGLIVEITEAPPGKAPKLNENDLYFFASNLSSFVSGGFNILEALEVLRDRGGNKKASTVANQLIFYVSRGASLSAALQFTGSFPPLFVNLVKSGERSGTLDAAFVDLADFYKTMKGLKSKISSATMYPLVISIMAVLAVIAYMVFVLPTMNQMFSSLGAQLPGITLFVINMADFFQHNWYWVIGGILLVYVLFRWLVINVASVKRFYERVKLSIPVIKRLYIAPEYLRLAKTMRSGYVNGLPVVEVLNLTEGVMEHQLFKDKISKIKELVIAGAPLYEAFKEADTDPLLWRTISIGTETGNLDNSLARYIDITQEEFNRFLDTLTAAVEPFALIFVGALVGFIVISLYLPMFEMIPALLGGYADRRISCLITFGKKVFLW